MAPLAPSDRYLPCASCRRHVKATDAVCPFCASTMPDPSQGGVRGVSIMPPPGRLSRIAVLAAGAALAATGTACSNDTKSPADAAAHTGGIGGTASTGGAAGGGTGGNTFDAGAIDLTNRDGDPVFPDGQVPIYAAAIALPVDKT